mgnify:CR=1 FL=1
MVGHELSVVDAAISSPGPGGPALGKPSGQTTEDGPVEAMRQLVGDAAAEAGDVSAGELESGGVAALETTGPPEGGSFHFQAMGFGDDPEDAWSSDEGILLVPADQADMMMFDCGGGAVQGSPAAISFHPVPGSGGKRHSRFTEPSAIILPTQESQEC